MTLLLLLLRLVLLLLFSIQWLMLWRWWRRRRCQPMVPCCCCSTMPSSSSPSLLLLWPASVNLRVIQPTSFRRVQRVDLELLHWPHPVALYLAPYRVRVGMLPVRLRHDSPWVPILQNPRYFATTPPLYHGYFSYKFRFYTQ